MIFNLYFAYLGKIESFANFFEKFASNQGLFYICDVTSDKRIANLTNKKQNAYQFFK